MVIGLYLPLVFQLALLRWTYGFLSRAQGNDMSLTQSILLLIEDHRNGATVNHHALKTAIRSLASLGVEDSTCCGSALEIYRDHFETRFIDDTEAYYSAMSQRLLAEGTMEDYLRWVEKIIAEEERRVGLYLVEITLKPLVNKCVEILISRHAKEIQDSFRRILAADEASHLRRVYDVLSRIPECLLPLQRQFEDYVKTTGRMEMEALVQHTAGDVDAEMYVQALLDIHARHAKTVKTQFDGEAGFFASLDKACAECTNRNAAAKDNPRQSALLLARHVDTILRGSTRLADFDLGVTVNGVVRYLYLCLPLHPAFIWVDTVASEV